MTSEEITKQLEAIADSEDFRKLTYGLTDAWTSASGGIDTVEPILRFMEAHPDIDYGMPGPLVYYVETFMGRGYEQKLVESIDRQPTPHTIWMLSRAINGTKTARIDRSWFHVLHPYL